MKRLFLSLLLLTSFSHAADTYTTRAGIIKPEEGSSGWGAKVRANYDIIDSSFAVLNATQSFSGGLTISSATFGNQSSGGYFRTYSQLYANGGIIVPGNNLRFDNVSDSASSYISNDGLGGEGKLNMLALAGIVMGGPVTASTVTFSTVTVNTQISINDTRTTGFFADPDAVKITRTASTNGCIGFWESGDDYSGSKYRGRSAETGLVLNLGVKTQIGGIVQVMALQI
jgi:hypothetical protein